MSAIITDHRWEIYGVVVLIAVLIYVLCRRKNVTETQPQKWYSPLLLVGIGVLVFGITKSQAAVRLQSLVIEARMTGFGEKLAYYQNPELRQAQLNAYLKKLNSTVNTSYRYRIPIGAETLRNTTQRLQTALIQPKLSEDTRQAASAAYGNLIALNASQETQHDVPFPTAGPSGYVINSNLDYTDKKLTIMGNHSSFVLSGGDISIEKSTMVFDGIDFQALRRYYQGILVTPDSSVVIRNGVVENLDQTLDGITWINVEFRNSMIRVKGHPFNLVNVTFNDCDLRWLVPFGGEVGIDLKNRIEKVNSQPITFAYLGSAVQPRPGQN